MEPVELVEFRETAIRGLVRGERIPLKPPIAAVLVKVVAGVYGLVDQRWVEYAQLRRGGLTLGHNRPGCDSQQECEGKSGWGNGICARHAETLPDRRWFRWRKGPYHYNYLKD